MTSVSPADRRAMARQAAALATFDTGEIGDDATRQSMIDRADTDRERHGLDPLKTEPELHRKAVERGLVRR
ncbi:MAG: hypothetical protein F2534_02250 [Actinobacteria bacterium]|nr:hypothetical protein [Actinomycetota bacterium]